MPTGGTDVVAAGALAEGAGGAAAAGGAGAGAAGAFGGADILGGAGLGMGVGAGAGAEGAGGIGLGALGGAGGLGAAGGLSAADLASLDAPMGAAGGLDLAGLAPSLFGPGAEGGGGPSIFANMLPSWLGGSGGMGGNPADPSQVAGDIQGVKGSNPYATENAVTGGNTGRAASSAGSLTKGINGTTLMLGALAGLGSALGKSKGPTSTPGPSSTAATAGPYFNAPLNPTGFIDRTPVNPLPNGGYQNYGQGPAQSFFNNNRLNLRHGGALSDARYADGGAPAGALQEPFATENGEHYVRGPGDGTSDDVPAKLSDGEYVLTARDVAALGNGSNEAGAKRLDDMRAHLHRDWGSKKPIGPSIHKGPLTYAREAA
jgi:hypothetical protein